TEPRSAICSSPRRACRYDPCPSRQSQTRRSRTRGTSPVTDLHAAAHDLVPPVAWLSRSDLAQPLPESTDVLVVGGGLAGTALSYYLARHGVEVVLVERGELNRGASGTNAGSFHFQIAIHQLTGAETENVRERLQTEVRLHVEAAEVWKGLERELESPL